MQKSCNPLSMKITQMRVGKPSTLSPNTRVLITVIIISINDIIQLTIPRSEDIASGAVENAMIPSREYLKSPQNDHDDVPTGRSTFS